MADVSPAEVQKNLAGVNYPARKSDLVRAAKEKGASDNVLDALNALEDREYVSPADVMEVFGEAEG